MLNESFQASSIPELSSMFLLGSGLIGLVGLRRRKLAAYERHIQLGLIAQGLLQYLAVSFRRAAWFNFHSYIRTASPQKPPSEWVVSHTLRHT